MVEVLAAQREDPSEEAGHGKLAFNSSASSWRQLDPSAHWPVI